MADFDAVFKAYDIRGTVPEQLDAGMCRVIGAAYARFAAAQPRALAHVQQAQRAAGGVLFFNLCNVESIPVILHRDRDALARLPRGTRQRRPKGFASRSCASRPWPTPGISSSKSTWCASTARPPPRSAAGL